MRLYAQDVDGVIGTSDAQSQVERSAKFESLEQLSVGDRVDDSPWQSSVSFDGQAP